MRSVSLLLLATLSHALVAPRTRAVAGSARRSPATLSETQTRLAALAVYSAVASAVSLVVGGFLGFFGGW